MNINPRKSFDIKEIIRNESLDYLKEISKKNRLNELDENNFNELIQMNLNQKQPPKSREDKNNTKKGNLKKKTVSFLNNLDDGKNESDFKSSKNLKFYNILSWR